MIKLDILSDENLKLVLNKFISSMLPHENYDGKHFGETLGQVFQLIKSDEFSMEYYVMFNSFVELNRLAVASKDTKVVLNRDVLEIILQNNVSDLVRKPAVRMRQWLQYQGMADNIDIESTLEKAMKVLYTRTMELYDHCFSLREASNEIMSLVPSYRAAFASNVAESSINAQRDIVLGSLQVGRNTYSGPLGWMEYTKGVMVELERRFSGESGNSIHITTSEQGDMLLSEVASLFEALSYYGIPVLDDETPMLKHRFVIITGNENVGKTTVMIDMIGRLIASGKRVVVMSGETPKVLLYAKIVVNYIFRTTGKFIRIEDVFNPPLDRPDINKLIQVCRLKFDNSGYLEICDKFSYTNIHSELVSIYERDSFDAVFFDHSYALSGTGDILQNLNAFAVGVREFKVKYPVFVGLLSHLSTEAKKDVAKGKRPSSYSTKGSSSLSAECDEEFVLIKTPELEKQGMIALHPRKRRGPAVPYGIILKLLFDVSAYVYDPAYQNLGSEDTSSFEDTLKTIEEKVSDDDEFGLYDEDGEEDDDGLVL